MLGDYMHRTTITLPPEIFEEIQRRATENMRSQSAEMVLLIRRALELEFQQNMSVLKLLAENQGEPRTGKAVGP